MLKEIFGASFSRKESIFGSSRKRLEEAIQSSEIRYRRLFETARDGILILDAESGNIVDVNPFLQKLLGYAQPELLGKKLWEIGVFKDIINSKNAFLELQAKGYIRYEDLPLETKDGRRIDVEFISNVYTVNGKKVIQCNIRDITDRKTVEKKIQDAQKKMQANNKALEEAKKAMMNIVEDLEATRAEMEREKAKDEAVLASIGDGVLVIDTNGKIVVANRALCALLGYTASELLGKKIVDAVPLMHEAGDVVPRNKRPELVVISGKESNVPSTGSTYYCLRKDKTKFPATITIAPVLLNNHVAGIVEVFRDITKEKEIDRAKTEFVSFASHQLRTPLSAMKWLLELLQEDKKITKKQREQLGDVYTSNERLIRLVSDLLSVSRIEAGKRTVEKTTVDMKKLIERCLEQCRHEAEMKEQKIKISLPKTPALIFVDPNLFTDVCMNLLINAIQYGYPKTTIDITAADTREGMYSIAIHNTGFTIADGDRGKLFTKFFRTAEAQKAKPNGSGLGLFIAKSAAEANDGKIWFESSKEKGTTFYFTVPQG